MTSPFGWRIAPDLRLPVAARRHRLRRRLRHPDPRRRLGTVIAEYFQTAWGNRLIIDHGFHHGVGLATITNHMSGSGLVNVGQHVAPRPGRRVRRHHRLVDRLPPALHGAAERRAR